jgi:hypothetical protein
LSTVSSCEPMVKDLWRFVILIIGKCSPVLDGEMVEIGGAPSALRRSPPFAHGEFPDRFLSAERVPVTPS